MDKVVKPTGKPRGRPPGTRNQNVLSARRAIADFVESNVVRFNGWLEQTANGVPKMDREGRALRDNAGSVIWVNKPDPLAAMKIVGEICEYHLPKLSRQDVSVTGTVAHLDATEITAEDLQKLPLADLKRMALEHFQHATQRGDTIDVVDVEVEVEPTEVLPDWLDPAGNAD